MHLSYLLPICIYAVHNLVLSRGLPLRTYLVAINEDFKVEGTTRDCNVSILKLDYTIYLRRMQFRVYLFVDIAILSLLKSIDIQGISTVNMFIILFYHLFGLEGLIGIIFDKLFELLLQLFQRLLPTQL